MDTNLLYRLDEFYFKGKNMLKRLVSIAGKIQKCSATLRSTDYTVHIKL